MAIVILGLGNDLLGDDAIGLRAAALLREWEAPDIVVRVSAQSGLYLLEHLQGFDDAIVIDSIVGDQPGAVRELKGADVRPVMVPSAHYAGLPEALALARSSGLPMPRRLRIFAVEMDSVQTIGSPPSREVVAALPTLLARVRDAAREWGYDVGRPTEAQAHA